jgi:hypothetical protein
MNTDLQPQQSEAIDFIGLHDGISSEDYHASPGLSFTGFKKFMRSPAHYQAFLTHPQPQSHAQKLGSLLHMLVLEPEKFEASTIPIMGPLNTNPYKKQADEAKEQGKIPIGKQMYEDLMGMRNAILSHPLASLHVASGLKELSAFWRDPETQVLLRCRPDIWVEGTLTIVDLKTCGDVQTFPSIELMRNKYHIQSAWYLMGMSELLGRPVTNHVHLCVETEYPYAVQCHALNDASIERAMLDIRKGLRRYAVCKQKNQWPGPSPVINPIAIPDFAWGYEPDMEDQPQ